MTTTTYLSPAGVTVHEFFLESSVYNGHSLFPPLYRVTLGDFIESRERQTFKPQPELKSYYNSTTGTIGFMDLRRNRKYIPTGRMDEDYPDVEIEEPCEVLCVEQVGIEPQHRRQGYAAFLVRRAEELAREWGLDIVYMSTIQGDPKNGTTPELIRDLLERTGYRLIGLHKSDAFKRLE